MSKINHSPARRMRRSVAIVAGMAMLLVGFSALSSGAQASPTSTHTLKGHAVCQHFATSVNSCQGGTAAREGKLFHYEWKSGFGNTHWTMLHANHSTCTSISVTWSPTSKSSGNHTTVTIVTDTGSKHATARGGKLATVSAKLTGTHAFIVKGYNSYGEDLLVTGQAICRTSTGH